jgi:hypothetical protein
LLLKITGKLEIDFPASLRAPRSRLSTLASSTMIIVLFATVVSIFTYKAILASRSSTENHELMIPALLNSIQVYFPGGGGRGRGGGEEMEK